MKVCFLGTPDFAASSLKALINSEKYKVVAVFTQPDKKVGRKQVLTPPPVKQLALEYDIPVYQPERIKDKEWIEKIKSIDFDIMVTAAFGQILSKELLSIPKLGTVNVHGSLLPKYRGPAPIQWAVIKGEKTTGITTMYTDEGIDTGDMLLKKEVEILEKETAGELFDRLADVGASLLIKTLDNLQNIKPIKQDEKEATYFPMLDKSIGNINFDTDAKNVYNLIRGLNPWPIATFELNGQKIKVYESEISDRSGKVGEIISCDNKNGIIVGCKSGAIKLLTLQAPGKKALNYKDFLNGFKVKLGDKV